MTSMITNAAAIAAFQAGSLAATGATVGLATADKALALVGNGSATAIQASEIALESQLQSLTLQQINKTLLLASYNAQKLRSSLRSATGTDIAITDSLAQSLTTVSATVDSLLTLYTAALQTIDGLRKLFGASLVYIQPNTNLSRTPLPNPTADIQAKAFLLPLRNTVRILREAERDLRTAQQQANDAIDSLPTTLVELTQAQIDLDSLNTLQQQGQTLQDIADTEVAAATRLLQNAERIGDPSLVNEASQVLATANSYASYVALANNPAALAEQIVNQVLKVSGLQAALNSANAVVEASLTLINSTQQTITGFIDTIQTLVDLYNVISDGLSGNPIVPNDQAPVSQCPDNGLFGDVGSIIPYCETKDRIVTPSDDASIPLRPAVTSAMGGTPVSRV